MRFGSACISAAFEKGGGRLMPDRKAQIAQRLADHPHIGGHPESQLAAVNALLKSFGMISNHGGSMVILRSHTMMFGIVLLAALIPANAQSPSASDESWTATAQTDSKNISPTRTTETYTKVGNRTIHKTSTQVLGPGGEYQPYSETETEIIQDNANSSRSIVRSYSSGPGGEKRLVQMTEEKKQQLPSGEVSVVRTMSNPDEYGNLKVVQHEVAVTKTSGPGSEETQSTIYTADGSGTLVPATKTREEKKPRADGSVETVRTTTVPDLSGKWQVTERVQGTERTDGQNRTTETVTLRPDYEGKLSEVSRTTSKESQTNAQNSETTQTYSVNVPGVAPDGNLHLIERKTTLQTKKPGETSTEQRLERRDPVDGDLKVMMTTSNSVVSGSSSTEGTKTTSVRGLDGGLSLVSSETSKSNQIPMQVQMSPADEKSASQQK
jgi:hypothetical protein